MIVQAKSFIFDPQGILYEAKFALVGISHKQLIVRFGDEGFEDCLEFTYMQIPAINLMSWAESSPQKASDRLRQLKLSHFDVTLEG